MITLTENAADKLGGIMEQKGMKDTHALRVFVKGGGCGGMQYGMTFDAPRETDEVYEQHGLRVIVDATSATLAKIGGALAKAINADVPGSFTAFLAGSTLYVTERTGAAFTSAAVVGLATQTAGAIASSASGS